MKTEIIDLKDFQNNNIYSKLKEYYEDNKLIAIPTETVYGLSADATREIAVKKIYEAKGRPSDNPLIVHFYALEQLENIVCFNDENVKKLVYNFWPGAMTLILKLKNKNIIAKNVTANLDTVAVRMPSDKYARKILKETKVLLAAPSANTSGKPSPTKFEHVVNDMDGKIDVIIKGDDSSIGLESTVVDCTKYPFVIARPGNITAKDIEKVLGENSVVYNDEVDVENPISPGMKYRHYSPDGDLIIYEKSFNELIELLKSKNEDTGFITYENNKKYVENLKVKVKYLAKNEENIEQSNKNLYNILREFDKEKVKEIYILSLNEIEKSKALINRINKASSKK